MLDLFRRITPLQWLGIIVLFNGTMIGGTNYLKDMMIPAPAVAAITSFASLANLFLGGLITMFSSPTNMARSVGPEALVKNADQESLVRAVLSMPGVQHLDVNTSANETMASMAMNKDIDKIGPMAGAQEKVASIAAGGTTNK